METKRVDIYFKDLKEETQAKILEVFGLDREDEILNAIPITIIERKVKREFDDPYP